MSRQALNMVLLLVGGALTTLAVRGTYLRYVTPAMRWPLLAAGLVVFALAVSDVVLDIRSRGRTGGGHVHAPGLLVWLFAVPALVLLFVGPTPLTVSAASGALSAGGVGVSGGAGRKAFPPLPAEPAPSIGFLDLSRRAALDTAGTLDGRTVTVYGTVVRRSPDEPVQLGRVVITCCAADARVVAVRVAPGPSTDRLASLPDGSWLRAEVQLTPGSATRETGYVPEVIVTRAAAAPVPPNQYEVPPR